MKRFARMLVSVLTPALAAVPVPVHAAPGTGVTIEEVSLDGDFLAIRGGSTFVDQPFVTLGTDGAGDVSPPLAAAGMDTTAASAATSLSGAVRLRWSLDSLPPVAEGAPGVVYAWNFCLGEDDCFELDLARVNPNPPSDAPFGILWRCADPSCTPADQTAVQVGGIPIVFDSASGTVTATLPPAAGAAPGGTISPVALDVNGPAFTMAGTVSPWTAQYGTGDGVATLADYRIGRREVSVAVGPPGLDPAAIEYAATVVPEEDGSWSASLDVSGATGELVVYARACFGAGNCGYAISPGSLEPVTPAFGGLSSPIRPGSQFGGSCTYNFVFYEEVYPTADEPEPVPDVFIGTAAHCTNETGQRVSVGGFGQIGTVVYDSDEVDSGVDFSLVRIDPELVGQTNPQMRGFEGPTGVATPGMLSLADRVNVYGYGIGVGELEQTRPRSGVLSGWTENEYAADMPAVNGDSGAPLLHDETGFALGIISRYGIGVPPSTDVGPLVDWALREIDSAGFEDVVLATVGG